LQVFEEGSGLFGRRSALTVLAGNHWLATQSTTKTVNPLWCPAVRLGITSPRPLSAAAYIVNGLSIQLEAARLEFVGSAASHETR
jgi:hypothetical protein